MDLASAKQMMKKVPREWRPQFLSFIETGVADKDEEIAKKFEGAMEQNQAMKEAVQQAFELQSEALGKFGETLANIGNTERSQAADIAGTGIRLQSNAHSGSPVVALTPAELKV